MLIIDLDVCVSRRLFMRLFPMRHVSGWGDEIKASFVGAGSIFDSAGGQRISRPRDPVSNSVTIRLIQQIPRAMHACIQFHDPNTHSKHVGRRY